jgi:hypothetical protein
MPVQIRGKQYFTVAERITMLHGDFPSAVGVETELIRSEPGIDHDRLKHLLEQVPGLDTPQISEIWRRIKRAEVVVRATVTIHTDSGERKFSGIAHERENIVDKRSVNATSYIENAETSAIGRALAASGRSGSEYCSADGALWRALLQCR